MGKPKRKGPFFKSLATSSYGEQRSTDGAFNDAERDLFLFGSWVQCRSTNVAEARWVEEQNQLEVVFKGGNSYIYPNITRDLAESFAAAPSKRGWIWDYIDRQGGDAFKVG